MRSYSSLVLALVLAGGTLAAGCSDRLGPTAARPGDGVGEASFARASSGSETKVRVLQRDVPLASPVSATGRITKDGGTIQIQGTGLKVQFPAGALKTTTEITVTAHAGSDVAYTFEPHGLKFRSPVVIDQAYQGTNAFTGNIRGYRGGYFLDSSTLVDGEASVTELLPVEVDQLGKKLRFSVTHFSGYLVAID